MAIFKGWLLLHYLIDEAKLQLISYTLKFYHNTMKLSAFYSEWSTFKLNRYIYHLNAIVHAEITAIVGSFNVRRCDHSLVECQQPFQRLFAFTRSGKYAILFLPENFGHWLKLPTSRLNYWLIISKIDLHYVLCNN